MFRRSLFYILYLYFLFTKTNEVNLTEEDVGECAGHPVMVSREEWRARSPERSSPMVLPLSHVIILHTVTGFCFTKPQCIRKVQFIQDDHLDERGFWDIAYSFLIGGDGRAYIGHGFNLTGAHSINFNRKSLGIAFIGDFMKTEPSQAMLQATQEIIQCGIDKGYLSPTVEIHGHRDVACSSAPGDKLYNIIRTWKRYKGGRLRDFACLKDKDEYSDHITV